MEAIRCEGLSKSYGRFVGLDRLDLVVAEGLVFGFLGPNGAGKTTTVKLLTGLGHPSGGKAWVAGQRVDSASVSFRSQFGYLPEEPAFYNWMTGREFLCHIGRLFRLGTKAAGVRADELLDQVGLVEAGGRRIAGYSRGMRQRLGLAQALVNCPRVLFLDEPCSALDPIGRRDVLELIQRLRNSTTVFMSTHILADVERVCDQVAVINHGRLVVCASVEELRTRYAKPVIELQFGQSDDAFASELEAVPWVSKVERLKEMNGLRILVRDAETARKELPAIVVASRLTLLRYEVVAPNLEDIFVSLLGGQAQRGVVS